MLEFGHFTEDKVYTEPNCVYGLCVSAIGNTMLPSSKADRDSIFKLGHLERQECYELRREWMNEPDKDHGCGIVVVGDKVYSFLISKYEDGFFAMLDKDVSWSELLSFWKDCDDIKTFRFAMLQHVHDLYPELSVYDT